jgi:DNA primase
MSTAATFKEDLKQQADIVRIIGDYVQLKKAGAQNFVGLCPFHKEKSPSFSVHAVRQFYHCFGCGESGDVFKFIEKIENITFPEAVRRVAEKMGVPVPRPNYSGSGEAVESKQRAILHDLHEKACAFFEEQLRRPEGARAREYLTSRGLSEEPIREFRIGYAPDSGFLLRDRLRGMADEELLKLSGLLRGPESDTRSGEGSQSALYSRFRNRVMFPICNEQGKVIAFTGRTLATDEKSGPKYLNSPETPIYFKGRVLFNLHKAKEAVRRLGYAILVEGNVDTITVFEAGFKNVIATSGTAFTEAQVRLLGRFTKQVVVNFDPDTAGANATEKSLAMLVEEGFAIKVLTLQAGFDPDLFIRRRGVAAYREALIEAPDYFPYLISRASSMFPVKTPEGKAKAVNYLLPHIKRIPQAIVRDELANNVAQRLDIDSAILRQQLRHAATNRSVEFKADRQGIPESEKLLIRAMVPCESIERDVRLIVRHGLLFESLYQSSQYPELFEKLLQHFDSITRHDEVFQFLTEDEGRFLSSTLAAETAVVDEEDVRSALSGLRAKYLENELRNLLQQRIRASNSGDLVAVKSLFDREAELREEMRSLDVFH